MNWTQYPDKSSRRSRINAVVLEGQFTSNAPGGKWYLTPDGKFHLVKTYQGTKYCVATECPNGES